MAEVFGSLTPVLPLDFHPRPRFAALLDRLSHPFNGLLCVHIGQNRFSCWQLRALTTHCANRMTISQLSKVLGSGLGLDADHLCDLELIFNLGIFLSSLVNCKL